MTSSVEEFWQYVSNNVDDVDDRKIFSMKLYLNTALFQEKSPGFVRQHRRAGGGPLGPGWMSAAQLGCLLLLYLERSQVFRKGQA